MLLAAARLLSSTICVLQLWIWPKYGCVNFTAVSAHMIALKSAGFRTVNILHSSDFFDPVSKIGSEHLYM